MQLNMPEYIGDLVKAGVEVTIRHDDVLGFVLDMNTQAKSDVLLREDDGRWFAHMRYDEIRPIEDVFDLMSAVKHAEHGKGFMNSAWKEILYGEVSIW